MVSLGSRLSKGPHHVSIRLPSRLLAVPDAATQCYYLLLVRPFLTGLSSRSDGGKHCGSHHASSLLLGAIQSTTMTHRDGSYDTETYDIDLFLSYYIDEVPVTKEQMLAVLEPGVRVATMGEPGSLVFSLGVYAQQ